jgi:hypothetical protein
MWRAQFKFKNRDLVFGTFYDKIEAARVADYHSVRLLGFKAYRLNFPEHYEEHVQRLGFNNNQQHQQKSRLRKSSSSSSNHVVVDTLTMNSNNGDDDGGEVDDDDDDIGGGDDDVDDDDDWQPSDNVGVINEHDNGINSGGGDSSVSSSCELDLIPLVTAQKVVPNIASLDTSHFLHESSSNELVVNIPTMDESCAFTTPAAVKKLKKKRRNKHLEDKEEEEDFRKKRPRWSKEEDQVIINNMVEDKITKNKTWCEIAKERLFNRIDPDPLVKKSEEVDHQSICRKADEIAKLLHGRSSHSVKCRWYNHLRSKPDDSSLHSKCEDDEIMKSSGRDLDIVTPDAFQLRDSIPNCLNANQY